MLLLFAIFGGKMKRLVIATAAILAATLVSGSAFAVPGSTVKSLEAPAATITVSCGCHHRPHYYHRPCCGYYSLYTYATPCYTGCGCGGCGGWGGCGWGSCGGYFGGFFGW